MTSALFEARVAEARRALRGQAPWSPELTQPSVLAVAAEREFAAIRDLVRQIQGLLEDTPVSKEPDHG